MLGNNLLSVLGNVSINPTYAPRLLISTAIAVAGFASCFSKNEAIKIPGMTVTMAVAYGILNDMIACRDSIEYFTVGHFWDGRNVDHRLIMNLNPTINAIFWGIFATATVSVISGCIFSILSRAKIPQRKASDPNKDTRVTAKQIFPYLSICSVITFITAHLESRKAQQRFLDAIEARGPWNWAHSMLMKLGLPYEKEPVYNIAHNPTIPLEFQPGWTACAVRNFTGYQLLGLGTMLISTGIVATRAFRLFRNWYNSKQD